MFPTQTVSAEMERRIADVTEAVARELGIRGLINIQFVMHDGALYILEANPRASRTVPIISKATGINLVAAATRIATRRKAARHAVGHGPAAAAVPYMVVKVPVFSFAKMRGVETILGPEMKSTGEVLGIDATLCRRAAQGFLGAGIRCRRSGGRILVSIADEEKPEVGRRCCSASSISATRWSRRPARTNCSRGTASPPKPINAIADGSPQRARRDLANAASIS